MVGEDGSDVMPVVGDSVDLSVSGVIKSVMGDMAEVELQTANGEPLSYSEKKEDKMEDMDEEAMMRGMAMEMDGEDAD